MNKRALRSIALALLLAVFVSVLPARVDAEYNFDEITGEYVILIEAESGAVLYEKNAYESFYPASTTKILTCIIAIEHYSAQPEGLDTKITVGSVTDRGTLMGLHNGEHIAIRDVLYGLMLKSGNDAAEAIADAIAGGKSEFAVLMNEKAAEIGMTDSHFVNPNGLHKEEHVTTAYDMALLARYAMQNETFRKIVGTREYEADPTNKKSGGYEMVNTNRLLNTPDGSRDVRYEYATGIKTGNTKQAGYCLVASAEKNGVELISVILGDPETSDKSLTYNRFIHTKWLFEWGFEQCVTVNADSLPLTKSFSVTVGNASFDDPANGVLEVVADLSSASLTTSSDILNKIKETPSLVTYETNYEAALIAPVAQGQTVGTVTYYYEGEALFTCNLAAARAVDEIRVVPTENPSIEIEKPEKNIMEYMLVWILIAAGILIILLLIYLLFFRKAHSRRSAKRSSYYIYQRRR